MAALTSAKSYPIAPEKMESIAKGACDQTLVLAESYVHSQTESWNSAIINKILESLVAATSEETPKYKYAIHSTIVQHLSDQTNHVQETATSQAESSAQTDSGANEKSVVTQLVSPAVGVSASKARRGMHSATGAYWNNETDGMWSYKYDAGDTKGMDVVISVIWVAA